MLRLLRFCLLLYIFWITICQADNQIKVDITPRVQKVAENSVVVFTCMSSIPGVKFSWFKGGQVINEERDDVTIRKTNAVMSVLRIEAANIKKHKNKYMCRVSLDDSTVEKSVNLRVIPTRRLHRHFPHIATDVEEGNTSSLDPRTLTLRCTVTEEKSKHKWRWIRDEFVDLSLSPNHDNGRFKIEQDGTLTIRNIGPTTSGTYRCVAESNRGTAYGPLTTIKIEADLRDDKPVLPTITNERLDTRTCIDRDGRPVLSGEVFLPEEDPCLQCECDMGNKGRCKMVACDAPPCEKYTSSRDSCCGYTCLDTSDYRLHPSLNLDICIDNTGRRVANGEMYQPSDDPCAMCKCENGRRGPCTEIMCDRPPCLNFRSIPGTCCGFNCLNETNFSVEVNSEGGCRANDGSYVDNGESYQPRQDPCFTCTCTDGRPEYCRSLACYPEHMPCSDPTPVPGECCKFTCEPPTTPAPPLRPALPVVENFEKILGRVYIQQIGSSDAIVQWKVPAQYQEMEANLTVYLYNGTIDRLPPRSLHIGNRLYAILRDLDPNTMYRVMVNGTVGYRSLFMTSRTESFSLDGRGRYSFVLSDAIGQVFEARGSISYTQYSLPRKFESVARTADVKMVLNLDSFHRVEVSMYNESLCMNQECGLLRFFMYTADGEAKNVMSLMFVSHEDFVWAKAHL